MHLAVALDGTGWHPAAWREPGTRPGDLFTAGYWTDLVRLAETGKLDFVTIEDTLHLDGAQARGRLDAVLIASRVAPLTSHIGLVPTLVATHTEPFHLSKAIATLDYVSGGRAGALIKVSTSEDEYRHFGRREVPVAHQDLLDEAADYVEVLRRLWDSWEDDAEIRDAATGRFIDRGKLHYIDFKGKWFSVKGPSITPRPPQGQPPVAGTETSWRPEVLFSAPGTAVDHELTFADVPVFLDVTETVARERAERLGGAATAFTGTVPALADQLIAWQEAGFAGFRLHPAVLPHDLTAIVHALVPELQRRGVFRREYEAKTLRGLLGLGRPANRYAA